MRMDAQASTQQRQRQLNQLFHILSKAVTRSIAFSVQQEDDSCSGVAHTSIAACVIVTVEFVQDAHPTTFNHASGVRPFSSKLQITGELFMATRRHQHFTIFGCHC